MVEFKKCKKCQANRIGFEWIQNNVRDILVSNKDSTILTDSQTVLKLLRVAHSKPEINKDGRTPCSMCLSEYGQMINDAVYSFKKQNYDLK